MEDNPTRNVARVFDEWADTGRDEGMETRHAVTAKPVLARLSLEPEDRFLDLGTGNGWAARFAQGQGAHAVGVDAALGMLSRARERGGPIAYVGADFAQLPFPDACFDAAFSMEALYYARDLAAALQDALRVLVPGARLDALIDYYEENPASEDWPAKTGVLMHRLSEDGWRRAFEAAGFADVGTQRIRVEDDRVEPWKAEHGSLYVHGRKP